MKANKLILVGLALVIAAGALYAAFGVLLDPILAAGAMAIALRQPDAASNRAIAARMTGLASREAPSADATPSSVRNASVTEDSTAIAAMARSASRP